MGNRKVDPGTFRRTAGELIACCVMSEVSIEPEVVNMGLLDIIIIVLVIAWLGGFSLHIGGGLVHLLLVIAVIVLVARFLGVRV